MKKIIPLLAISGLLLVQLNAYAVDDYQRPDNVCGQLHADKSGKAKDAAITKCIQERYKAQRSTGSEEIEHAQRKQCNAGPDSKEQKEGCKPEKAEGDSTAVDSNKKR